jgi:AcrR family transcriptional regulator
MPRPRNPPRRDELVEAATDYLLENGIDKLTMRSLAQGVGVSTYAFAYHFKSKEALLTASLQRVERRVSALVLRTPDRFPGLLAGVEPSGQVGFLGRVLEAGGLASDHAEPLATLMVAALTGLQIDFLCSGDADRTGRTVALLARLVDTEAGGV